MQIPEPQVEGSKRRSPTKPGEVEVGHSRLGGELIPGEDVDMMMVAVLIILMMVMI